ATSTIRSSANSSGKSRTATPAPEPLTDKEPRHAPSAAFDEIPLPGLRLAENHPPEKRCAGDRHRQFRVLSPMPAQGAGGPGGPPSPIGGATVPAPAGHLTILAM